MRDWITPYREELVGRGRRARGVASYVRGVTVLLEHIGTGDPVPASALTRATLTRWRNERAARCAPATVHAELCVARSFCQFLVDQGVLADDPTHKIIFPTIRKRPPRALHPEQVRAMIAALEIDRLPGEHQHTTARARLGVYLFLYTGLRLAEVAALRWRHVRLDAATITVEEGKGGVSRAVPIHPRLARELSVHADAPMDQAVIARRDGECMHPKSVAEIFTRWLVARGVTITAHQLRHTFATTMLRAGAPLPDIQHALGHASLETTQMYLLVDAGHLKQAVGLLPDTW